MNYKKLVSAISAVTLLAGLAVVPNAMAEVTDLVYAGTGNDLVENADGTIDIKYKYDESIEICACRAQTNKKTFDFSDSVSSDLKSLFADSTDGTKIDSKYTSVKLDYIGSNNNGKDRGNCCPSIAVNLEAGSYNLYYVGGKNKIESVDAVGCDNEIVSIGAQQQISDSIYVYPIKLYLSESYDGDIKFVAPSSSYLPDLYSIKITDGEPMKTQDDVISAEDIIRPLSSRQPTDISGLSWNNDFNGVAKSLFGDLDQYTKKLEYTSDTDYCYIDVTETGEYKMYIIGEGGNDTKVNIINLADGDTVAFDMKDYVSNSINNALLYESMTFNFDTTGIYKIELSKLNGDFYTNFIAAAFEKIVDEPEPVLTDPTAEVTDVVTSDMGDGDMASAVKASVTPNDYTVTGLTWTFKDVEKGTGTYDTTNIIISGTGAVDYVLYINGYLVPSADSVSVAVSSKAPVSAIN